MFHSKFNHPLGGRMRASVFSTVVLRSKHGQLAFFEGTQHVSEIKGCVCNKDCCQARFKMGNVSETVAGQTKSFTSNSINKQTNKPKPIPQPSKCMLLCAVGRQRRQGRIGAHLHQRTHAHLLLSPRNVTRPTGGREADDVWPKRNTSG